MFGHSAFWPAKADSLCTRACSRALSASTLPGLTLPLLRFPAGAQAACLRSVQRSLLVSLRPQAVPLVDAFGYTDYLLNSALGRADGNVYQVCERRGVVFGGRGGVLNYGV